MAYRDDLFDPALLNDCEKFERYVKSNKKIGNVRATMVMSRWRRLAPQNPFEWFLFDDIAERPEKARADILTFLGADPEKRGRPWRLNRRGRVFVPLSNRQQIVRNLFSGTNQARSG
jgi:hypothetical protein